MRRQTNEYRQARISLNEGVIELEGTEEFVRTYLDEFKGLCFKQVSSLPGVAEQQDAAPQNKSKRSTVKKSSAAKKETA